MSIISPKIEIINHFDDMIHRIDIDTDSSLEIFNDQQLISDLLKSSEYNRRNLRNGQNYYNVYFIRNTIDSFKQNLDSWPESTKVVDYLKQTRLKTIEQLRKAQDETLEFYKLNSERFKDELTKEENRDKLRAQLFADKFYFQVRLNQSEKRFWAFDVFTFVTDFYFSQSYIDLLEKLINEETKPFSRDTVIDHKMFLTALVYKFFKVNLYNFPNHVINVKKQDILNIVTIAFNHEYSAVNLTNSLLSKLVNLTIDHDDSYLRESVKFNIEGLSSLRKLHLGVKTSEVEFSINNLPSLTKLYLSISGRIDDYKLTRLLDRLQHIEELCLDGNLSFFNLDSLVNLKKLSLSGTIDENFNLELFRNLCNQLEYIKIELKNIDETTFVQLFNGYNFQYLVDFTLRFLNVKRLRNEFINGFRTIRNLIITHCKIEFIEHDSFSNFEQLCLLDLSRNRIQFIGEKAFLKLKNLQSVNLKCNNLLYFDPKSIGLRKSAEYQIENNTIII